LEHFTAWTHQFVPKTVRDLTAFGSVTDNFKSSKCNQTKSDLSMRVSKGVRVLIFGMAVMLGFSVSAPKMLAQG